MSDAIAWIKKWGWALLSALAAILGVILGGWLRAPKKPEPPPVQPDTYRDLQTAIHERERATAEMRSAVAQERAKLEAIWAQAMEREKAAKAEAARKNEEIQRQAESADPDTLRSELVEGAKKVEGACDEKK